MIEEELDKIPDLTQYWEKIREQERLKYYNYQKIKGITDNSNPPVNGNSIDYVPDSKSRYYCRENITGKMVVEEKEKKEENVNGIDLSKFPVGWKHRRTSQNYAFINIYDHEYPIKLTIRRDGKWWISARDEKDNWVTLTSNWEGNIYDALEKMVDYEKTLYDRTGIKLKK